jgi:hypothetical protein
MRYMFLLLTAITISGMMSCQTEPSGFALKGTVQDAGEMKVFLDKWKIPNSPMVIANTETDGKGSFEIGFEEKMPAGVYRLRIGAQKAYLVLDGTEGLVEINTTLEGMAKYDIDIKGSKASEDYVSAMNAYANGEMKAPGLRTYVSEADNAMVAMQVALSTMGSDEYAEMHVNAAKRVSEQYPGTEYDEDYKK